MPPARLERWIDPAACAVAVVVGLGAWWPARALPFYWDGATFVVDAARDLLASGFWPLIATHSDFAHPPLFVALLALAWRLFGESRVVAHALVLPALPAAMIATYVLGRRASGRLVGILAALLLAAVPVVLEEVGQVYPDLPLAALVAWGLVAWTGDRRWLAGALFTAAALMKIPAPLLVPGALLALGVARRATRRSPRALLPLGLPFAADAAWVAYHRAVTGWALWRPGRVVATPHGIADHARALGLVFEWLLLDQWRWALLAGATLALAWQAGRRRLRRADVAPLAPLLAPVALGLLFFAAVGEFGMRYGIALLPGYLVATLAIARAALPGTRGGAALAVGGAGLLALCATTWHPARPTDSTFQLRPDEDLAYLDQIDAGEQLASWLERRHPDAEIYGAGPESYELAEPWQGYVSAPLAFAECKDFTRHPDRTQLVVLHPYHPQQARCRRLVEATGAQLIQAFQRGSKWRQVYRVPAAPTGTTGSPPTLPPVSSP